MANINVSNPQDCHNFPELKRKLYSAMSEGDEGELSIAIPKEVSLKQSGQSIAGTIHSEGKRIALLMRCVASSYIFPVAATPEPQTPGPSFLAPALPEYMPITVNIAYSLRNPVDGFQFILPSDSYPYVSKHGHRARIEHANALH